MPRFSFIVISLLSFLCVSLAAESGAPEAFLEAVKHSNAQTTPYCNSTRVEPKDLNCASPTSGDFYGVGVRLGVYFTWIASWIANLCNPDEIGGALDANAIFLIALMVSMFYQTAHTSLTYIDGLILMQICAGYMFGCFSIWGYRTVHYFEEGSKGNGEANETRYT